MIETETQYQHSLKHLENFKEGLANALAEPEDSMHPLLRQGVTGAFLSIIVELRKDLNEYEARHKGVRDEINRPEG